MEEVSNFELDILPLVLQQSRLFSTADRLRVATDLDYFFQPAVINASICFFFFATLHACLHATAKFFPYGRVYACLKSNAHRAEWTGRSIAILFALVCWPVSLYALTRLPAYRTDGFVARSETADRLMEFGIGYFLYDTFVALLYNDHMGTKTLVRISLPPKFNICKTLGVPDYTTRAHTLTHTHTSLQSRHC